MNSNKNNMLFVREYHERKENGILTLDEKHKKRRDENGEEHTVCK